jgi:hypothetical protein
MFGAAGVGIVVCKSEGQRNDIPKKCQTDVDQEISTTPSDCVDTDRRDCSTLAFAIDGFMVARGLTKQRNQDQEYRRNHTHLACCCL